LDPHGSVLGAGADDDRRSPWREGSRVGEDVEENAAQHLSVGLKRGQAGGNRDLEAEALALERITELSEGFPWSGFIGLVDDPAEAVAFIRSRPPREL